MTTKKKQSRFDFLPEIGQFLITAMRGETIARMRKNNGSCPIFTTDELYKFGAIPFDFEARWNAQRAIEDVMRKACEYGFVKRHGQHHWGYIGPEVREEEKRAKRIEEKRIKDIRNWLTKKGIESNEKINHYNRICVIIKLPKELRRNN